MRLQDFGQFLVRASADHLFRDLSVLDQKQGRNGSNTELAGEFRLFVHVNFGEIDFFGVLIRQFLEGGRDHAARSAPGRPKVYESGFGIGLELLPFLFVEVLNVCHESLILLGFCH